MDAMDTSPVRTLSRVVEKLAKLHTTTLSLTAKDRGQFCSYLSCHGASPLWVSQGRFRQHHCILAAIITRLGGGCSSASIEASYPGQANLANVGFNDIASSFHCFLNLVLGWLVVSMARSCDEEVVWIGMVDGGSKRLEHVIDWPF